VGDPSCRWTVRPRLHWSPCRRSKRCLRPLAGVGSRSRFIGSRRSGPARQDGLLLEAFSEARCLGRGRIEEPPNELHELNGQRDGSGPLRAQKTCVGENSLYFHRPEFLRLKNGAIEHAVRDDRRRSNQIIRTSWVLPALSASKTSWAAWPLAATPLKTGATAALMIASENSGPVS
jgi:hypothetical protein